MNEDNTNRANPLTRRTAIKCGSTLAVSGLLAGCIGQSSEESASSPTPTEEQPEPTETANESTPTEQSTEEPTYTAELSPVGEVTLEEPPTNVFTHFPWFADMATALDRGESVNSVWWDGTASTLEYFTAGLDGVEIAWRDRTDAYGFSKEQLYEFDSDLHLVDPAWVTTQDNWAREDVDEIAENAGPWLGNYYSSFHQSPPKEWTDDYEYHRLWDVFEQVGSLYGEQSRYEKLRAVHDDLRDTIEAGLPPEDERPTAAFLSISADLSTIYVLRLNAPGYFNAHTRPLGAVDAFSDEEWDGAFKQVDMEAVLDANPDVLLALWTVTDAVDFEQLRQNLNEDPVGRELAAVQNDRVAVQGTRWQGPLMNLFQLEMTAKQLYPEQFGAWPSYENGDTYPEFSPDEQLFDHQLVADIISGNS
ncbi:ABC transporter substrate-binding protein [Halovenus salina]|uniref:ABC transporter substrate-binding protein n=1 Tax=Halovenus salina TaxID=1510225 RepID=A0ABD5VZJ6_9EURY|nr:ABC transporter substrate-binding protein [Halovenus salina]